MLLELWLALAGCAGVLLHATALSATSVTIVSGAIAERVKIVSYVTYAIVLTSFIYPLVGGVCVCVCVCV